MANTTWFCKDLGDANIAQVTLETLKDELIKIHHTCGEPKNMWAGYQYLSQGLHCHIELFITANFQEILMLANATRCLAPSPKTVEYLAGYQDYWPINEY
ncbi:hypothetical protein [Thalassotalea sp. SU-HH00458]|uniref:hypothetical protein n=1 Tax=Thalassotalea sp. SU-HH00458 TaxID=3127657 RepID=UPI003101FEB1